MVQILVWLMLLTGGITLLIGAWPLLKKLIPATWSNSTAAKVADKAAFYTQYVAARAQVLELRLLDATNGSVDLKPELDAIDAKLATMFKQANTNPPAVQGQ